MEQKDKSFSFKRPSIYSAFLRHFAIINYFLVRQPRITQTISLMRKQTPTEENMGRKRGDRKHLGGTGRQLKRNKLKKNESHI